MLGPAELWGALQFHGECSMNRGRGGPQNSVTIGHGIDGNVGTNKKSYFDIQMRIGLSKSGCSVYHRSRGLPAKWAGEQGPPNGSYDAVILAV